MFIHSNHLTDRLKDKKSLDTLEAELKFLNRSQHTQRIPKTKILLH